MEQYFTGDVNEQQLEPHLQQQRRQDTSSNLPNFDTLLDDLYDKFITNNNSLNFNSNASSSTSSIDLGNLLPTENNNDDKSLDSVVTMTTAIPVTIQPYPSIPYQPQMKKNKGNQVLTPIPTTINPYFNLLKDDPPNPTLEEKTSESQSTNVFDRHLMDMWINPNQLQYHPRIPTSE